jgi:hypothetical protein
MGFVSVMATPRVGPRRVDVRLSKERPRGLQTFEAHTLVQGSEHVRDGRPRARKATNAAEDVGVFCDQLVERGLKALGDNWFCATTGLAVSDGAPYFAEKGLFGVQFLGRHRVMVSPERARCR